MQKRRHLMVLWASVLVVLLAPVIGPSPVAAAQLNGQQTYDLLFKEGTLNGIPQDKSLIYQRETENQLKPDAAKRDSGEVVLSYAKDDPGMVTLNLFQGEKHRGLGQFPASVGNPMIMYFYESIVRDMAESAGGSPFYIRNRIKESLIRPNDVEEGQGVYEGRDVPTKTVRLHPFAGDPNSDRMKGFGDLELVVVMSDDVPGWYLTMSAKAADVYHSELRFDSLGGEK